MNTAIIFDFFGVFCTPPATTWFKKRVSTAPEALAAFQSLCTQSDYGKLSRADFNEKTSKLTGVPIPEIVAGISAETHIDSALVAYVRDTLLKSYRVACLSNGSHEWTLQVITGYGLGDLFETIVLSGDPWDR